MKLAILSLLLLGCAALTARSATANGIPIRVPLSYLAGLSNWGPTDARGEAEISYSEAAVRLDARGLPQLTGETYAVWLVKSGTNKAVAVGTFTSLGGVAGFTGKLTNLDGYDYDLVMITVEPVPDLDPAPSARRSIGGFFASVAKPDAAPGLSADTVPATLPQTGEAAPLADGGPPRSFLGYTLIGIGFILLFSVLRRRKDSA